MRYYVELSNEAQKQLARFPRDVTERIERAIDELETKDEADCGGDLCHRHQIERHLSLGREETGGVLGLIVASD